MIDLIVRCHGRLEYTLRCLDALSLQVDAPPFEVILVDNASPDATQQQIEHVLANEHGLRSVWPRIRYHRQARNLGDWQGMVEGAKHVRDDARWFGQLDNDIALPRDGLAVAAHVLERDQANVCMLRRHGVRQHLGPTKGTQPRQFGEHTLADLRFAVAFWLCSTQHVRKLVNHDNCRSFTQSVGRVVKVQSLDMLHLDGVDVHDAGVFRQALKYGKGRT